MNNKTTNVLLIILILIIGIGVGVAITKSNSSVAKVDQVEVQEVQQPQNVSQNDTNAPVKIAPLKAMISVVDEDSGITVKNPSFAVNGRTFSDVNAFVAYMQTLPSATYSVNVSAPGYKTMSGIKVAVPENLKKEMIISLQPASQAHVCPRSPSSNTGFLLCGHITDESANPVSGVQISSPNFASISATTGSDGYFETEFSPLKNYDCGEPVTFTYTKSGYKTLNYVLNGPYIYTGGDLGTKLTMKKGTGSEQQVNKHGMCN